ncbi:hypothetical protein ABQZ99_017250 [Xanthomonas hortorum pv. vitians]|uniref:Uncharacterized protein n=2 Tax=Xanthomonas hortorum TaxID=56454 RepID=A0A0G8MYR1_9XANT|nr:hypothetical protein [Xanthomonas hortorum]APP79351.1 hypothetical protein BJD10_06275 [Xanthomonas hortorum pv. gardneri]APP83449.1 hypothetical protein BI317_03905 [Xanthomonas hortorum pv. gardneri]ASW46645.1 hypothetical protein XJ27_12255 [Xanthomonas hortorum]EGD19245.1 hypothetical protein XGA_2135 [Xanthomonas hortorum ATCC 19865]KLA96899.1 hypothetical protein SM19410_11640 [Xanthomonas hortorum pv. gardneri]
MYVGHFAIGLALKASFPGIPTLPLLLGVGFLDILDGIFIMLGWDIVTPNFAAGPYLFFDLTFIDWDHSLLAAVVWSVVWACLFWKDRRIAVLAFVASFSHFLADWPMHNNDLALLPHSQTHFGLGLWGRLGTASWVIEGVFVVVLAAYAWNSARKRGVNWIWPLVVLTIAFFNLSPWLSPMKHIAVLDEPAAHLLHGLLVTLGFLLPGALLTWLVNREERKALRLRTR